MQKKWIFFKPTLHDLKSTNLAIVMEFMAREKRYSRVKWPGQNFHSKNWKKSMKFIENPSKSVPKIATNVPEFIEIDCAMVWKHNLTNSCTRNNEIL